MSSRKPRVLEQCCGDRQGGPCRLRGGTTSRPSSPAMRSALALGGAAGLSEQPLMQLEIFALGDRGESYLATSSESLPRTGSSFSTRRTLGSPSISLARSARLGGNRGSYSPGRQRRSHRLQGAGYKARRRAEDLFGMGGDPPLLPQRTDIEEAGIGHDRA